MNRKGHDAVRAELLALLAEDSRNVERMSQRLDSLETETGIGTHAALFLTLTRKSFADEEAKLHWAALVARHAEMSAALDRDVGLRVALMDYLVHVNRQL